MSTKFRGFVVFLAALVCFALLFSCFFIAYEASHVCCQERCAICCLYSICQNLVKSLGWVRVVLCLLLGALCTLWLLGDQGVAPLPCPTLVSNKVKLSN